jgi:hypothetical protein
MINKTGPYEEECRGEWQIDPVGSPKNQPNYRKNYQLPLQLPPIQVEVPKPDY